MIRAASEHLDEELFELQDRDVACLRDLRTPCWTCQCCERRMPAIADGR